MSFEQLKGYVLIFAMTVLAVTIILCMVRSLVGPRIADRLVGINMITTQVIIIMCILVVYLHEEGLADVAIIFAMLSFLSTVVFTKMYTAAHSEKMTGIPDVEEEESKEEEV